MTCLQQGPLQVKAFLLLPQAPSTILTDSWRADRMLMFEKKKKNVDLNYTDYSSDLFLLSNKGTDLKV